MLTTQGGIVGAALDEAQRPQCPRCERCGCGMCGSPGQLMICSTCLPTEVLDLRRKLKFYQLLYCSPTMKSNPVDDGLLDKLWREASTQVGVEP